MMRVRLLLLTLTISLLAGCVGPLAPDKGIEFTAVFTRTNNLFEGSDVRILGVPKGKVLELTPRGDEVVATIEMQPDVDVPADVRAIDRKSTRLNSSHANISYAVFCLKKNNNIYLISLL